MPRPKIRCRHRGTLRMLPKKTRLRRTGDDKHPQEALKGAREPSTGVHAQKNGGLRQDDHKPSHCSCGVIKAGQLKRKRKRRYSNPTRTQVRIRLQVQHRITLVTSLKLPKFVPYGTVTVVWDSERHSKPCPRESDRRMMHREAACQCTFSVRSGPWSN